MALHLGCQGYFGIFLPLSWCFRFCPQFPFRLTSLSRSLPHSHVTLPSHFSSHHSNSLNSNTQPKPPHSFLPPSSPHSLRFLLHLHALTSRSPSGRLQFRLSLHPAGSRCSAVADRAPSLRTTVSFPPLPSRLAVSGYEENLKNLISFLSFQFGLENPGVLLSTSSPSAVQSVLCVFKRQGQLAKFCLGFNFVEFLP